MVYANLRVIERKKGFIPVNLHEIWEYRELLYFLAWRDIKVKYKQTAIGIIWALVQPLLTMVVFSLFFGHFAKMPSEGMPYPIFVYAGLLPWQYFASVLGQATASVVGGAQMITKIYFPRVIMPASTAVSTLLDFFIAMAVLFFMMAYYGIILTWAIFIVPFLLLLTMMTAVGFGLWFSALNVRYRDIQYAIPFLIQIWMFVTPVIYPMSLVGEGYSWVFLLNPMSGVIEAYRAALLGHVPIAWMSLGASALSSMVVFIGGLFYFRSVERYFSDII